MNQISDRKNYDFCKGVIALKDTLEQSFIELGARLRRVRDLELWRTSWSSWHEFCDELKMDETKASKLISIYEKFVIEFHFSKEEITAAGGWSNVYEFSTLCQSKEDAQEWLHKAKELLPADLRKEIREKKSGKSQITCNHDWQEVHIRQCRGCGLKEKIFDESL